jgi:hypothetical protein
MSPPDPHELAIQWYSFCDDYVHVCLHLLCVVPYSVLRVVERVDTASAALFKMVCTQHDSSIPQHMQIGIA